MDDRKGCYQLLAIALVALIIAAVGMSLRTPRGSGTRVIATTIPTRPRSDPASVTREQYGADWPFTVAEGSVRCLLYNSQHLALFEVDGTTYAMNGTARSVAGPRGYHDIDDIWLDDPKIAGAKISISPILTLALSVCPD